ncbi:putative glutamyl endopeptidase, chloroplastic, partial [Dichanthelium oligosanthes]
LSTGRGYRLPPKEIQEIVDVPSNPSYYISPRRDRIMFLKRRSMPPLSELAKPDKRLAGIRIDPSSNARRRMSFYTGISIHLLMDDGTLGPEKVVNGYNDNAKINFVGWSPDGQHVAFTVRHEDEVDSGSNLALWIADAESGKAQPLFKPADIMLNAVFELYAWVNNSSLLVSTIPSSRGDPPTKPLVPFGPSIHSNEQRNIIQMRSTKEMLKDLHEEELFDYYATSQLVLVTLDGTVKMIALPAIYTSLDPSPDEKYLMLTSVHRPYSSIVSYKRFPKKVELWTIEGRFVREVCDLPLAEDIPVAANSVRKGKRLIRWRPDMPSTLYCCSCLFCYNHCFGCQMYRKICWCYGSFALAYEYWYKTRITRTWVISPDLKNHRPRLLYERSSEDAYLNPGSPVMCRTPAGTLVIARIKRNCEGSYILLKGRGATPKGSTPFLDLFNVNTGEKERIWESDKEKYYESILALISYHPKCEVQLDQLKLLVSKESRREITQYYVKIWPNGKQVQITNYPHPYPQLALLQKEIIRYQREDGVKLTATLYLPPGYSPSEDGPLPCLIWSYPGEFKSKEAAEQVRRSPNKFARISNKFPLLWLSRGFAILADPTIPIIGEGNQEGNDRYIEQLVASAEAAVNEIVRRGVAHPDKIAVGGHSYGAFMTANLLAHAPHLFCCGIARSGAYNRTLTPFGFQSSQFYDALKGHGVPCRLVILPFEQHQYAARESIMHVIWETDRWLQKYCATKPGNIKDMEMNVDTSQSPTDAVLDHEALTLNFTKISSLIKLIRLAFTQIVFRRSTNSVQ